MNVRKRHPAFARKIDALSTAQPKGRRVIEEHDPDTDLYIRWSPEFEAYVVTYGDGTVAMTETLQEARAIVKGYGE